MDSTIAVSLVLAIENGIPLTIGYLEKEKKKKLARYTLFLEAKRLRLPIGAGASNAIGLIVMSEPKDLKMLSGDSFQFTATFAKEGKPVADHRIEFVIDRENGLNYSNGTEETNNDGKATYSIWFKEAGKYKIQARAILPMIL